MDEFYSVPLESSETTKIIIDSLYCSSPRKSLVKGERFMRGEEKPELMHPQKHARFVDSVMIHLSCWWCLASCRGHCRWCSTPYICKHNIQRALKSFIMHHLLMISIPSGCSTVAIFSAVANHPCLVSIYFNMLPFVCKQV